MANAVESLTKAWLDLVKAYKDLFFLEFKLARYSFIPFCFTALLFVAALGAFWITTLAVIVYAIHYQTNNWLYAFIAVESISAFSVILIFIILYRYFKQLKFNHLRQQLKNLQAQEAQHEQNKAIEKAN